jgi:hypothetical protein
MDSVAGRKEYLKPVKHRGATVMGAISIPARLLACTVLKTVCSVPVIQIVKQPFQLPRMKYTNM